jgi:adenylate cyclase
VLVTGASALGYLEPLQARALDLLLRLQGRRVASNVVIVAIDQQAFDSLGGRQPISRAYLARLVRALQRSGAAVVGLDVSLSSSTTPSDDAALARAIREFGEGSQSRVVVVDAASTGDGPLAASVLARSIVHGSAEVPVDDDGVVRHVAYLIPRGAGRSEPAFALAVAARLGGTAQHDVDALARVGGGLVALPMSLPDGVWMTRGGSPIPLHPGELSRINFVGPARSFLTIPSEAVVGLADPRAAIAQDNALRGRIVLVGGTFREGRDVFQTPHGPLPGVEIHANVVHMLLTRSFIRPTGWLVGLALQTAVVLLTSALLVLLRPLAGTLLGTAAALLVSVPGSYLAFQRGGYWVDFVLPVIVTCVLGFGAEALARRRFRASFARYVSREVASHVLAEAPALRGELREVSVLFSDLRGFTTLSETMPADSMAAHLNEYFEAMTSAIFAHRGMINDFIGDAVMAIFSAPLADPDHAWHAVQSAVAMESALDTLNSRWQAAGLPALRMGIGIHTGTVFAGNVGAAARLKYTVLGDAVNVAARVEGLNKELESTILITEETRRRVGSRAQTKDRGPMSVKGRAQPVRVYEVLALDPEATQ